MTTYAEAKLWLSRRRPGWGWTREDIEAQEIVSAAEGILEPESLRHLRETYTQAATKASFRRPTLTERIRASLRSGQKTPAQAPSSP